MFITPFLEICLIYRSTGSGSTSFTRGLISTFSSNSMKSFLASSSDICFAHGLNLAPIVGEPAGAETLGFSYSGSASTSGSLSCSSVS
jgi:hypothetical protein